MVRPASFGWNPQTQASNRFQRDEPGSAGMANLRARAEFDGLVLQLQAAGIAVTAAADTAEPGVSRRRFSEQLGEPACRRHGGAVSDARAEPAAGTAPRNHRVSLRASTAARSAACSTSRTTKRDGRFLEGTGSLVFDHVARVAYACLSPRTDPALLGEWCAELGYAPCTFEPPTRRACRSTTPT